jgi:hypothetical protein
MIRPRRDPLVLATERFVAAGGRLMLSPRGRLVSVINSDLVVTRTPVAEERLEIAAAFRQARMSPGSSRRLKYMVGRHGMPAAGWRVWGG